MNKAELLVNLPPLVRTAFEDFWEGGDECGLASAPGRVNIIGEHMDYNGLAVLPAAMQRRIYIAFRKSSDSKVIASSLSPEFTQVHFAASDCITSGPRGNWGNYIKGSVEMLSSLYPNARHGFEALVWGDIPLAAGLSSSSALVVASALTFAKVNDLKIEPIKLSEICARAEWYSGTRGGCMDQTISMMGQKGCALLIHFEPLTTEAVEIPEDWRFIVCNSRVQSDKSDGKLLEFNRRPLECRLACLLLSEAAGLPLELLRDFRNLEPEALNKLPDYLPHSSVSVDQASGLLGITKTELLDKLPDLAKYPEGTCFEPFRRARHVLSEADRVYGMKAAMLDSDIRVAGALMDASHASCRDDFEISTPELESLTSIAREAGASGARLTGAGFGGCVVVLATNESAPIIMDAIQAEYYGENPADENTMFIANPSAGAMAG